VTHQTSIDILFQEEGMADEDFGDELGEDFDDGDLDDLDSVPLLRDEDAELDGDDDNLTQETTEVQDTLGFLLRYSLKDSAPSDVFADFGANSLFLLDGEALLAHCLEDRYSDREYGGEPLHLIYLFLFYLERLTERDARFRIVFFANVEPHWPAQIQLVRSLLISHVKEYTKFDIDVFKSYGNEFDEYLFRYSPTNVMTKILWFTSSSHLLSSDVCFLFISISLCLYVFMSL
jgi:hypothetical protein